MSKKFLAELSPTFRLGSNGIFSKLFAYGHFGFRIKLLSFRLSPVKVTDKKKNIFLKEKPIYFNLNEYICSIFPVYVYKTEVSLSVAV